MPQLTEISFDIVKADKNDDGTMNVYGKATGPDLDSDRQIADGKWLAKAMPEWFQTGANIREMHKGTAAGVGVELTSDGDDWYLQSLIVDPISVKKVEKKVLGAYSIGISDAKVVKDAAAPGGRIVDGNIVEVSIVDRPANPTCKLTLAKSVDGTLTKAEELTEVKPEPESDKAVVARKATVAHILKTAELAHQDEPDDEAATEWQALVKYLDVPSRKSMRKTVKKAADAQATTSEERFTALEAQLAQVVEQLAKADKTNGKLTKRLKVVEKSPTAGGPAVARQEADARIASRRDELTAEVAKFTRQSDEASDPDQRLGYAEMAREAKAALDGLED